MKNFVICLENHKNGQAWLPKVLESANNFGWNLEVFPGINGLTINWDSYNIKIDTRSKKSLRDMARPGVKGCFLSHWYLWQKCVNLKSPIGIFEYDVIFKKPAPTIFPTDVIKLDGFKPAKPSPGNGQWWGGAHAYIVTPTGAKKLLDWTDTWGANPADVMLGDNVVDIAFDLNKRVERVELHISTTLNLEDEMR